MGPFWAHNQSVIAVPEDHAIQTTMRSAQHCVNTDTGATRPSRALQGRACDMRCQTSGSNPRPLGKLVRLTGGARHRCCRVGRYDHSGSRRLCGGGEVPFFPPPPPSRGGGQPICPPPSPLTCFSEVTGRVREEVRAGTGRAAAGPSLPAVTDGRESGKAFVCTSEGPSVAAPRERGRSGLLRRTTASQSTSNCRQVGTNRHPLAISHSALQRPFHCQSKSRAHKPSGPLSALHRGPCNTAAAAHTIVMQSAIPVGPGGVRHEVRPRVGAELDAVAMGTLRQHKVLVHVGRCLDLRRAQTVGATRRTHAASTESGSAVGCGRCPSSLGGVGYAP